MSVGQLFDSADKGADMLHHVARENSLYAVMPSDKEQARKVLCPVSILLLRLVIQVHSVDLVDGIILIAYIASDDPCDNSLKKAKMKAGTLFLYLPEHQVIDTHRCPHQHKYYRYDAEIV